MSRIGKKPIEVPKGVQVSFANGLVKVVGPKGTLQRKLHQSMDLKIADGKVQVTPRAGLSEWETKRFHGLTRTLVANMCTGVTQGFSKTLTMIGVGYRAAQAGKNVTLTLGYSHPIEYQPPQGIEVKVDKQTTLIVSGAEKELVGQVTAVLRSFRAPEPYHGKGVRYADEVIVTKVGKAAGKAK